METFELLGEQIVKEVDGGEEIGAFDPTFLVNAAAGLAQGGVAAAQAKQAEDKTNKDSAAALSKSMTADASWADAETQLDLAQQSKDQTRIAAAQSLQSSTMMAALQAGQAVTGDAVAKRVQAAQDAQKKAAQDSLSNPKDGAKAARMRAWQKVAAAVVSGAGPVATQQAAAMSAASDKHEHEGKGGSPSFFTKQVAGLPVWGWGVGLLTLGTGTFFLVRALRKH